MEEKFEKALAGFLENSQSDDDKKIMAAGIQAGEIKGAYLENLKSFYDQMGVLPKPEPSAELRSNFYQMLLREKQKEAAKFGWLLPLKTWLENILAMLTLGKVAYSIVLLSLGLLGGYWINQDTDSDKAELAALSGEMQQMKKMVMLSLLEKPSTTQRLKAVNLTNSIETADQKVIQALLQTLNQDPSVNVRLAAIEALYQHANNPEARQGLVQSINKQDSPLVQLALADIMVAMQEKDAVKPLQRLLQKENLNETVKAKVKQSIEVLI